MTTRGEDPFDRLQREFNSLFGRFMGPWLAPVQRTGTTPRFWDLDVSANDEEVVVRAEVPGFDEKELDLRLDRDVLTIRAEKEQKDGGREEYHSYFETVALPPGVNPDGARAEYRNGVLEVHVPRSEDAQPRRITIQG
jgi:HSP20 family protein